MGRFRFKCAFLEEETKGKLDRYADLLKKVFNVYTPRTGSEALKLLEKYRFAIIFLGIMVSQGKEFPRRISWYKTGIHIIREIKEAFPANKNHDALLVVLSASADLADVKFVKRWADVYLESPQGERSMGRLLDIFF